MSRSWRWESRLLLVASGAVVTALSGCGSGSPPGAAGAPSMDDVVATAQQSLRAGGVLHQKVTVTQDAGDFSFTTDRDLWLDGKGDALRETSTFTPAGPGRSTQRDELLAVDGVLWSNGKMLTRAPTCYGGVAVSALLGCPSLTDADSTVSVRLGSWHGRPALVLVFHRTSGGEDTTETVDGREFLDATTAMPLAQEEAGRITGDGTVALHRTTTFAGGFVDDAAVAADFFDIASLGWHAPDPEQDLPTDVPVYWLGRTFDPGGGLPALRFAEVESASTDAVGYSAILKYNPADDPVGAPALTIVVWTQAALDASPIVWGDCATQSYSEGPLDITLRCPNVSVRRAEVRTGRSFLSLSAPGSAVGSTITASPYNTSEALLTAARALTLWQPGTQQP